MPGRRPGDKLSGRNTMYRELRACVGVHLTKCSHVRRPCRIMESVRGGGWGMLRANGEVNETPASNNSASVNHT